MKKRGFTLIELLAVIVVLAIIALIATPIVMNVIKDAQKGAAERSAERYVNAVEMALAADRLENDMVKDGIYTVDATGNLVLDDKTLTVAVSGDRPASGSKVAIKNGQVVKEGTDLDYGDYTVTINDNGSATAKAKGPVTLCKAIAPTEEIIYRKCETKCEEECGDDCWWDAELDDEICEVKCWEECYDVCDYETLSAIAGIQATEAAPYAPGTVYSCDLGDGERTFYVLKEDGDNVKLIMNESMGSTVAWINKTDFLEAGGSATDWSYNRVNYRGPITANNYLASQTEGWKKLKEAGGIVELPAAQDIADAMGDKEWKADTETVTVGPAWITVNTYLDNLCVGYWTSTPNSDSTFDAWIVSCTGKLILPPHAASVDGKEKVRPVIVIPKKELSL